MKLKFLAVIAALGIAGFAGPAAARVDVSVGIGLPGAVYYEPAPVYREYYYQPAPVYYYGPRYYGPSRVYYYQGRPAYHYYREERRYDRWHDHDGRRDGHGGGHRDNGPREWRHSR